jgi:SNF2 family DNA or RNA helicase
LELQRSKAEIVDAALGGDFAGKEVLTREEIEALLAGE